MANRRAEAERLLELLVLQHNQAMSSNLTDEERTRAFVRYAATREQVLELMGADT